MALKGPERERQFRYWGEGFSIMWVGAARNDTPGLSGGDD